MCDLPITVNAPLQLKIGLTFEFFRHGILWVGKICSQQRTPLDMPVDNATSGTITLIVRFSPEGNGTENLRVVSGVISGVSSRVGICKFEEFGTTPVGRGGYRSRCHVGERFFL